MATTDNEFITRDDADGIAWITIDRPKKLNALSTAVMGELSAVLSAAEADPTVKVVVLQGVEKAFSVGYDIAEEVELGVSTAEQWHAGLSNNVGLTMQVWELSKPVIGAVSGWCLAGGCELAMACDMLIATEDAQFGEPEIRFGSGPVTLIMPFVLGQKKTNELLYTGDIIDAPTALDLGLVNKVVPADQLQATVQKLARKVALTPLPILRYTKMALNRAYEAMGLRDAVKANLDIAAVLNSAYTEERREFTELVAGKGLGAALAWRDERYAAVED
ncbi:enoyl-CoA hydratase/isomerase family protein [Specibacter cremeus]|uniref:enoyl-CoA hydratase/isomerase family protein n=1 Tax=Specibacter cremeus TaxID=1629051 RepID=UPI000F789AF5|nr:enoyl-CoA hydratase/isomerase family protein [Specibacter cremeus]